MNARNLNYIGRYNKRSLYPLVDDKLQTKRLSEEYEIPVPKLLAAISQQHEVRGALDALGDLTGFAMKPAKGSGGSASVVRAKTSGPTSAATRPDVSISEMATERH